LTTGFVREQFFYMKRTVSAEWLDSDAGTAEEVSGSLADLGFIARWFGGAGTLVSLLEKVAARSQRRQLSILDVGSGRGDVASLVSRRLGTRGLKTAFTLLDRSSRHLKGTDGFGAVTADALALPFTDESFDVVACSAFAHHLGPQQIVEFAGEALRVARLALVINDLRRHPLHLALVYAGFPLFRSRLTRHDGPASVRRAYTTDEMRSLLELTGERVDLSKHYLFRLGAIVWKQ
jgi:SAM-dependent methyltransferase